MAPALVPLALLLYLKSTIGSEYRITSTAGFSTFVNRVNSGTTYSGTTVYLDSDLSLSGYSINPIGTSTSYYFRGVFDGQGQLISNLKISTSSYIYTGLFGYSKGLTIRNVVLDSSCSITNSYSSSNNVFVGGIMGCCDAYIKECIIENSVNMADVSFSGTISSYSLLLGGIAGWLYYYSYNNYVKNCANYGSVTHSGTSYKSFIGGFVGDLYNSNSGSSFIYNSLNYGTITHSGTTSSKLYLGGIAGYSYYTHFENCVSAGKISTTGTTSTSYIRSIMGYSYSSTHINYCYYTNNVGISSAYYGSVSSTTGTPSYSSTISSTLISNMNAYASNNGWNKWILNTNNADLTLKVNDSKGFSVSSSLIMLPNLTSDSGRFVWSTDSLSTTPFLKTSISSSLTLYGTTCASCYAVTFDPNGGSVSRTAKYATYNKAYGDLPTPTRTGYTFTGWFTEKGKLITSSTLLTCPSDHTLYAHWEICSYKVTLDPNGGSVPITAKYMTYNKAYGYLPEPTRTGHTFIGWFTEKDKLVTSSTLLIYPSDHTLYAHWEIDSYNVTFDANGGNVLETESYVTFNDAYGDLPEPTRTGYTFIGWFTEEDELITPSTLLTYPFDHTLYAHWEICTYNITFDLGFRSIVRTFAYNDKIDYPYYPEREGYTFKGWDNDAEFMPDYNLIIKAAWTANTYAVTFDVTGGNELHMGNMAVTFNSTYDFLPMPAREGHTFIGWFIEGDELITNTTTVSTPADHTLYAAWTTSNYVITFAFGDERLYFVLNYGDNITYPQGNPSKLFHKFRGWCTKDIGNSGAEACNVTNVPASDLTFTAAFDVDWSLITKSLAIILAEVFVVFIITLFLVRLVTINDLSLRYGPDSIELDERTEKESDAVERRIEEQMAAMSISKNAAKKLATPFMNANRDKALGEILADLEVECEGRSNTDVVESFRTTNASAAVATALRNNVKLVAAAEYLRLLYATVREQEEYEEFGELYFGMEDIDEFMDKMDDNLISFGGIVSGFTSKRKAIQFLIPSDEEDSNNMPSGVLFKVSNGKGYRIGKLDEETDEVLFEMNSVFKVESVREVARDRFITVNLSFVSPQTDNDMIEM